jgi:hypothetical protein
VLRAPVVAVARLVAVPGVVPGVAPERPLSLYRRIKALHSTMNYGKPNIN